MPRWLRWPQEARSARSTGTLAYGADYNPEQWPPSVWREDVALMREAGVNLVNVGVFGWAEVQPAPGVWELDWLDQVMDLLHEAGIAVDLGTGTSSPPPWLTTMHPEILPVTADGTVLSPGGRQHWRPTSPVFRDFALRHVRVMAERYADHPALALWHVSNELGCHNVHDYSEDAAQAFRRWVQDRYGDLDRLNDAWGTAFWSQRHTAWDQVLPPRVAASYPNPTQQLDFARFSSDSLRDYLRAEVAVLREVTPDVPITTNFMVMGETRGMNYATWVDEIDLVSNDHYLTVARPDASHELCFSANLVRGLAGSTPWFLMEHSTGAVNWQPVNLPKPAGQLRRDSLAHVAHGSDAVSFFQWRQSRAGAEKYHSAMVPHAGTDSRVWREVVELGADLGRLGELAGSRSEPAAVAVLFDWDSWWASELDSHPSSLFRYRDSVIAWYQAFHDLGVAVDVQPVHADLSPYAVVVTPSLYIVDDTLKARLQRYVIDGGHLLTTYFSGIADEDDHIYLGGYPGALRALLGIRVEELAPLPADTEVALTGAGAARLWAERVDLVAETVTTLLTYGEGALAGQPVATRNRAGEGTATYVGADVDPATKRVLADGLLEVARVARELPREVADVVTRRVRSNADHDYTFYVSHSSDTLTFPASQGFELLTQRQVEDKLELAGYGVAVVRSPRQHRQLD